MWHTWAGNTLDVPRSHVWCGQRAHCNALHHAAPHCSTLQHAEPRGHHCACSQCWRHTHMRHESSIWDMSSSRLLSTKAKYFHIIDTGTLTDTDTDHDASTCCRTRRRRRVYMHICMHATCIHACVEAPYVCLYVCMNTCMYLCMHVSLHVCLFICMYVCAYVCMYVCMYAYMHACIDLSKDLYLLQDKHTHHTHQKVSPDCGSWMSAWTCIFIGYMY